MSDEIDLEYFRSNTNKHESPGNAIVEFCESIEGNSNFDEKSIKIDSLNKKVFKLTNQLEFRSLMQSMVIHD